MQRHLAETVVPFLVIVMLVQNKNCRKPFGDK